MQASFQKRQIIAFGKAKSPAHFQHSSFPELDLVRLLLAAYPAARLQSTADGYTLEPKGPGFLIKFEPLGFEVNAEFSGWRGMIEWPAFLDYLELALVGRLRVRSQTIKDSTIKKWSLEVRPIDGGWREVEFTTLMQVALPRRRARIAHYSYPELSISVQRASGRIRANDL